MEKNEMLVLKHPQIYKLHAHNAAATDIE